MVVSRFAEVVVREGYKGFIGGYGILLSEGRIFEIILFKFFI